MVASLGFDKNWKTQLLWVQNVSEKKNDYIVAAEKRKVWSKDILTKILGKIVKTVESTSEGWTEESQWVTRPTNEEIKVV